MSQLPSPKILVVYYSLGGSTQKLAKLIARGVEETGAESIIRTVPKIYHSPDDTQAPIPEDGDVYVSLDDLVSCDGLIVGSPTRFGNMAAPLKHFIDGTSEIWMSGKLANKPVSVFTSTSSLHGGQESTLLSMMLPFLHHGMIICGLPYSETSLIHTESGGTPYGVSHWSGQGNDKPISGHEKKLAIAQGKRLATIARQLMTK